jgi:transcriptional regulator with XRE-family HTH domain
MKSKISSGEVDVEAARRSEIRQNFGEYVSAARKELRAPSMSQGVAAKIAGISRETWNRIEKGKQIPDPANIPAIAQALKVDVVRLFERAGYEVPLEVQRENRKVLAEKLLAHGDESVSTVEFALGMIVLWQKEKQKDSANPIRYLIADKPFVQILIAIQENLSRGQQLRLAKELIQNNPIAELRKARQHSNELFDEIDRQLQASQQRVPLKLSHRLPKAPCSLYEVKGPDGEYEYHMIITEAELLKFVIEQAKKYLALSAQPEAGEATSKTD